MSINNLTIGEKVENQGITDAGKLRADEFNELVAKTNELIGNANSAFMTIANMESATEKQKRQLLLPTPQPKLAINCQRQSLKKNLYV